MHAAGGTGWRAVAPCRLRSVGRSPLVTIQVVDGVAALSSRIVVPAAAATRCDSGWFRKMARQPRRVTGVSDGPASAGSVNRRYWGDQYANRGSSGHLGATSLKNTARLAAIASARCPGAKLGKPRPAPTTSQPFPGAIRQRASGPADPTANERSTPASRR